ncbi:hypothetical protein CC1G_15709 [Coprinopsis cinerea okayama7|uniref:Uncharacterized protein n=1 Tax=Coprinopsis cinerea (strain Okayama-7 / 130 / ATCC MYA-4618 / FGSC 9003) TaxID=240176 RepID=D6RQH0_COPC7|nr:hypothetical protein CC1G_15709 [Coprinopsis cinerea okayama7\|eukprot:XP_002910280.1 hypothetical protein CC1G_15709 [Coprinopsis cinerea okayama7\
MKGTHATGAVEYDLKVRPARHMVFYKQQRLEWRGQKSRYFQLARNHKHTSIRIGARPAKRWKSTRKSCVPIDRTYSDLGSESRAEWLAGPTRIAAGGVGYQRMDELGFFIRVIEVLMEGKEDEEWQECEKVPSSLRQQPLSKISLVVVVERTIPALKVEPMHRSMVLDWRRAEEIGITMR